MKNLLASLLYCALLLPGLALAEKPDDQRAIAGMDNGRILWDITIGEPERLIPRLSVIHETYQDMQRQGLEPDMVFAFRGGAAALIAHDTDHLEIEDVSAARHIHERLQALMELEGIHMEACQIATRRFDLSQDDLIPGVYLVGNTFLSIMGYENQGYTTIRID
ncbi:DsrE family protein [Thioalkalivibrio sp. ALJT]|uniref:DsrE family protein n=1 Tax=Thioalkalivibrio sp. ALJT TaxID=1158146 RepID=UPI00036D8127|nr:DsrE family protein [Thioalkalivibrio sp. ALJT]